MNDDIHSLSLFENERSHLFGIAYRMLGSAAEADDILQETFLRWSSRSERDVDSPRAFLTTVLVRLCLDQLKSARARREEYVGPWLPEPIVDTTPEEQTERAESINIAFLVLLERLSPLERAAFLLHEVFDQPFNEVATTLGTSEAACRQLASRARAHVDEGRARFTASADKKRELLTGFLTACAAGDASALTKILADDVVLRSDGGGRVTAALKPIYGPDKVARFSIGVAKKASGDVTLELTTINGELGALLEDASGTVITAVTLSVRGDRITDVWIVNNPEKLSRLSHSQ
jgi:RNA polymerase sigma-70 factor, ECF subfamily